MTRPAVLLVLLPAIITAAPGPKLAADRFGTFGTLVATKGVMCETPRRGALRVSVAKDAAAGEDSHEKDRPLVVRTVDGDFELTVRIAHTPPEAKDLATAVGKDEPLASAGITLYRPDGKRGSLVLLQPAVPREGSPGMSTSECLPSTKQKTRWEPLATSAGTTSSRVCRSTSA